jgi:hypothetical protein
MAELDLTKILTKILNVYSFGVLFILIGLDITATTADILPGSPIILGMIAFFVVLLIDGIYTPKRYRKPVYTALAAIVAGILVGVPTSTFSLLAFGGMTLIKLVRGEEAK